MKKKIPMRTCIACRTVKPKKELIRIVKTEDGVFLDRTGKKNGRGAYICDDEKCIAKLKKGKLLNRTFSTPVDDAVYDRITDEFYGK